MGDPREIELDKRLNRDVLARTESSMKPKLSDLWRWDSVIGRRAFLLWGILLFAIKFNLDRFTGWLWFKRAWTVFDPEHLRLYLWQSLPAEADQGFYLVLLMTSAPFLWTGLMLTLGRLRSIGWSPWWVFLFLVPLLKLLFFALLCVLPSREEVREFSPSSPPRQGRFSHLIPRTGFGSAVLAICLAAAVALLMTWFGTVALRGYGWALFVGLPFCMGFMAVLIYTHHETRGARECLMVANLTVILAGLGMLLFAMEGVICIIMAAPIAFVLASIGGTVGYLIQATLRRANDSSRLFSGVILAMPLLMSLESGSPPELPLLEVKTALVVNASAQTVWSNVVSFSQLPPPTEFIFRLGVAYPVRAEIRGRGPGAIRHCVFSTGPFVEPIEIWDEPRLLGFSVKENPPPMQEWTPYREIHPAHLDGYLESRRGQFRLVPLDDRRTLLEGTTWYCHRLWPARYWQVWSDWIIHQIHLRVLTHVKALSERDTQ